LSLAGTRARNVDGAYYLTWKTGCENINALNLFVF
jgi:hypothetical protein